MGESVGRGGVPALIGGSFLSRFISGRTGNGEENCSAMLRLMGSMVGTLGSLEGEVRPGVSIVLRVAHGFAVVVAMSSDDLKADPAPLDEVAFELDMSTPPVLVPVPDAKALNFSNLARTVPGTGAPGKSVIPADFLFVRVLGGGKLNLDPGPLTVNSPLEFKRVDTVLVVTGGGEGASLRRNSLGGGKGVRSSSVGVDSAVLGGVVE